MTHAEYAETRRRGGEGKGFIRDRSVNLISEANIQAPFSFFSSSASAYRRYDAPLREDIGKECWE